VSYLFDKPEKFPHNLLKNFSKSKDFNAMFQVFLKCRLVTASLPTILCLIIAVGCSTSPPSNIQKTSQKEIDAVFDDKQPERGNPLRIPDAGHGHGLFRPLCHGALAGFR
jgi:hypothetical protein